MEPSERDERIEELRQIAKRDKNIATTCYVLTALGLLGFFFSFMMTEKLFIVISIAATVFFLVLALVMGGHAKVAERAGDDLTEFDPMMRKESKLNKRPDELFVTNMSLIEEAQVFSEFIDEAGSSIENIEMKNDLEAIKLYVQDIFKLAAHDTTYKHEVRRFSRVYLPETLKLVSTYLALDERNVSTKESERMQAGIAKTIAEVRNAFANMNRSLLHQTSVDINTEMETFKRLLSIDVSLSMMDLLEEAEDADAESTVPELPKDVNE